MSRAAWFFIAFCGLLLLIGYSLVQWMGPVLWDLAFDDDRKDQPYHVMYFFADADPVISSLHRDRLQDMLVTEGATPLWSSEAMELVDGGMSDEWQSLLVMEFPSGSHFVQIATSSTYRQALDASPLSRVLVVGTKHGPLDDPAHYAVLLLYLNSESPPTIDSPTITLGKLAVQAGGEIIWKDHLDSLLSNDVQWRQLVLVGFSDPEIPAAWLYESAMVTERALLKTRSQDLAGWLIYLSRVPSPRD